MSASALLTDLCELNMAARYLKRGMNEPATFSLLVRSLPSTQLLEHGVGPTR